MYICSALFRFGFALQRYFSAEKVLLVKFITFAPIYKLMCIYQQILYTILIQIDKLNLGSFRFVVLILAVVSYMNP